MYLTIEAKAKWPILQKIKGLLAIGFDGWYQL
jgi:hypothetical protein